MRKYKPLKPEFWKRTGKKLRKLGADHIVLALYLMSCGSSNISGLYYLPIPTMAYETGLTPERCEDILATFGGLGFAMWDDDEEVVWVVDQVVDEFDGAPKNGDKRIVGIVREAARCSDSQLHAKWVAKHRGFLSIQQDGMPHHQSTQPTEAPSKPLTSPSEIHVDTPEAPSKHRVGYGTGSGTRSGEREGYSPNPPENLQPDPGPVRWQSVLAELRNHTPHPAEPISVGSRPPDGLIDAIEGSSVASVIAVASEFAELLRGNPSTPLVPGDRKGQIEGPPAIGFWSGGAMFRPKVWAQIQLLVTARRVKSEKASAPAQTSGLSASEQKLVDDPSEALGELTGLSESLDA